MNIFSRELKINFKGLCYWCLVMLFMVGASVGKTQGLINEGGAGFTALLRAFPQQVQNMFGMSAGLDYSKPISIFAIVVLYVILIAAFHAALLGAGAFAKEERDRTFEFLYVKGATRARILTAKLCADALQMVILNAFTYLISVFLVQAAEHGNIAGPLLPMMIGTLVVQLVFYALGLLLSLLTRRMRFASTIAFALIIALFLLSVLSTMFAPDAWYSYVTPFKYFDGTRVLVHGLGPVSAIAWVLIGAAMTVLAYALHNRRDLHT